MDENEQCNSERKSLRSRELNPFGERDIDSSTSPKGEEVINCMHIYDELIQLL
jgi:hypothetical protein